jgi:hypothetical protein
MKKGVGAVEIRQSTYSKRKTMSDMSRLVKSIKGSRLEWTEDQDFLPGDIHRPSHSANLLYGLCGVASTLTVTLSWELDQMKGHIVQSLFGFHGQKAQKCCKAARFTKR